MNKRLRSAHAGRIAVTVFRYIILTGLVFVILYPFLIKLGIAFMDVSDLNDSTVRFIPKNFTFDNFINAAKTMDYVPNLFKTIFFTVTISFVQVVFAMLAAYGFASFKFPGRNILFGFVLLTLIVPPQAIVLPLYLNFQSFDIFGLFKLITGEPLTLLGSPVSLYLLAATGLGLKNGLIIFIFRQFFKGFPRELEESASIDGAGVYRTFLSIIVPSAVPMILTAFLFTIVWQWTDSFYTSIFVPNNTFLARSLEMLVTNLSVAGGDTAITSTTYYYSLLNNAGILLFIAPILVLYLFCQRHFVESIERTGLVG